VFGPSLDEWAEARGVLRKAIEDAALGMASVYRSLELDLPHRLPPAGDRTLRLFQDLVARIMPFDLVIDEETARGDTVRVSRGSVCGSWGGVAGSIRFFADRQGVTRGAVEGTQLPYDLIRQYATPQPPTVAYDPRHRRSPLVAIRRLTYFGFELDKDVAVLETVPPDLAPAARAALVEALVTGAALHKDARALRHTLERLGELYRRSGGTLAAASSAAVREALGRRLAHVQSLEDFQRTDLALTLEAFVPAGERHRLDALPSHVMVHGEKCWLNYDVENGQAVVRLRMKEGVARRLRAHEVPRLDRPVLFTVVRGKQASIRAASIEELRRGLTAARADRPRSARARTRRRRS
jgi:hypothetical protein